MNKSRLNITPKHTVYILYIFLIMVSLWLGISKSCVTSNNINNNNIKVSVIIPVYNTEKYLDSCLESVENQTLKDIEIICINDGSKDNSLEILKNHKSKDNRIKIIDQENSGVSAARNAGIKKAIGEYITFVDSDDLISPYLCEINYNNAKKYDTDIIEFGDIKFKDGEKENFEEYDNYDNSKILFSSCQDTENPFDKLKIEGSIACSRLWKRDFLIKNNIYFKEGISLGEDSLFDWIAIAQARRVLQDKNVFYYYRIGRESSATGSATLTKQLKNYMLIIKEIFNNYDKFNFKERNTWILNLAFFLCYDRIYNQLNDQESKINFSKEFISILNENLKKYNIKLDGRNKQKFENLENLYK